MSQLILKKTFMQASSSEDNQGIETDFSTWDIKTLESILRFSFGQEMDFFCPQALQGCKEKAPKSHSSALFSALLCA